MDRCSRCPTAPGRGRTLSVGCVADLPGPLQVDITSSGNDAVHSSLNTALGAHGGGGLSAVGGVIRMHEVAPSDGAPISHALKLELFARQYYYGGLQKRRLQPATKSNGGRTQYVWPATGSDGYTWDSNRRLGYNGSNPHLAPGALLALPEAVASAPIPHLHTAPGKRIAAAFRDYVGYIIDDTACDSSVTKLRRRCEPALSGRVQPQPEHLQWSMV